MGAAVGLGLGEEAEACAAEVEETTGLPVLVIDRRLLPPWLREGTTDDDRKAG